MLTAYKFRLYPNEKQEETFSRYFGCSRVVWNRLVKMRIKARSTSHDPEKQELHTMRKLKLSIGAGSP